MLDLTGTTLKAYKITDKLGAGGFGAVYKAIQSPINREVAIKVILPEYANRPEFIQRFETEAQLVARLEHPYIIPLYDYWREPNSAYLVMRYLRGGNLREWIEERGTMPVELASQMIGQVGSALALAHRHGVVHRDIKSDNVLIDDEFNFYLTDFGIAKDMVADVNLTNDSILGTPAYISPEQIRGEKATAQSDIYALGIMAFESLSGGKPFFDMTPASVLFKQLNEPLPDVTEKMPDLPMQVNLVLQRATAKDPALRHDDVLSFVREFQASLQGVIASVTSSGILSSPTITIIDTEDFFVPRANPFKGLRAFQQADAQDFFGRETLVERLTERLRENHPFANFLAVIGPSGSGKSSVVKAGLLPKIHAGEFDTEANYFVAEMVPGTHPLEELESALLSIAPREVPDMMTQLEKDGRGLIRTVKRILPEENSRLVLLIDQFEEVFTLIDSEKERQHFLDMLVETVNDARSRVVLLITIRADFYDKPLMYAGFGDLIRQRNELVLPLSPKEIEEAVVAPVKRVGLTVEQGLVSAIVKDVKQQPGALPLLQYALTELFERREGRVLTLKAYEEIGGTSGALARRAEEIFKGFDVKAQEATRQLFLRLVTLGEGAEDTRRRVTQEEIFSLENYADMLAEVIDIYGKYRLLTFDHDPQNRASTVEVAHEALIRQWERLRSWLDDNREGLRTQRRLTQASEEWANSNRDRSYLARGSRLQQFQDWAARSDVVLNQAEQTYLNVSLEEREKQERVEQARVERERQLEERAQNRLRLLAVFMTFAAVVGLGLAGFAFFQSQQAIEAREQAEQNAAETRSLALASNARNARASDDPRLALALALQAESAFTPVSNEVFRTLSDIVYASGARWLYGTHTASITSGGISHDGYFSLTAGLDSKVYGWDNRSGEQVLEVETGEEIVTSIAFAPDGKTFVTAYKSGQLNQWEFPSGTLVRTLAGHEVGALSVAFSPNGRFIASGGEDKIIRLWSAQSGALVREFEGHIGAVLRVVFSPDGTRLLSSSADENVANDPNDQVERAIKLWLVATGEELYTILPASGYVRAIAYSPTGDSFAAGLWDSANSGNIRVYNAETGEETRRLYGHTDILTDITFTSDGRRIVSASWDKTVRIWDIQRGTESQSFTGFEDRIMSLSISPDDSFLLISQGNIGDNYQYVSASNNNNVWWWDMSNRDQLAVYRNYEDWHWAVDINPDGTLAASGGGPLRLPTDLSMLDVGVRIWQIETGEDVLVLKAHTDTVDSVKFHPDGKHIFTSSWDGTIILWDLGTGEIVRTYTHGDRIFKIGLNADASLLVSGGADDVARVWRTDTGEEILVLSGHTNDVNGVNFSPDGKTIVTASSDQSVRLWDAQTGTLLKTFIGHTNSANEAIFTPDGENVISTSWDDTVRLWSIASGEQVQQFVGHSDNTFGAVTTKDGRYLFTTSTDRTVRLWDVASGAELHRYAGHTNWVQEIALSPDARFFISAGQDNVARKWNVALTSDELVEFARSTRYIRTLTDAECETYRLNSCE